MIKSSKILLQSQLRQKYLSKQEKKKEPRGAPVGVAR